MRLLDRLEKNRIYSQRTERFVDDVKDHTNDVQVEILGKYKFLMTNNPERWGIILWYERMDGTIGEKGFFEVVS